MYPVIGGKRSLEDPRVWGGWICGIPQSETAWAIIILGQYPEVIEEVDLGNALRLVLG